MKKNFKAVFSHFEMLFFFYVMTQNFSEKKILKMDVMRKFRVLRNLNSLLSDNLEAVFIRKRTKYGRQS